MRNIPGHGHTFVFRSKVVRLLSGVTKRQTRKVGRHNILQMEHEAKYIKMITNPKRKPISYLTFNLDELQLYPGKIRFNSIDRPPKRTKLRNNKRIAFLSCCPRWSVNAIAQLMADKLKSKRSAHISPNVKKYAPLRFTAAKLPPAAERLRQLPERYRRLMPVVDHSDKMRYTFEPLPPARILVQDKLSIDKDNLQKVNTPIKQESFYKPEVVALHQQYLEKLKLLNLA